MSSPGSELRRVRSLIADLDGIVWEADARTMLFTFVSSGSTPILGYTPQEWLADPTFWADRIHPDDRERTIAQFVRAATAGWSFDTEYRVLARDGSVVWLRDLGHVVRDVEGRPTLLRGLMVDVTKQKLVEEERRSAEERFRTVVERLPAIVYLEAIEDEPGASRPLLYVSPQVESILGFTTQEWLANPAARSDRFVTDDLDRVQQERKRVEALGEPFSAEYRMLARDGRTVWFRDEAVLVRDEDDRPVFWQGIMYDVTRQRESEALARETETRYRALVEQLPAIVYSESVKEGAHDLTYINSRVEEILGATPAEWLADPVGSWLGHIHPDDRDAVEQENIRSDRTGEPFVAEYRMTTADDRTVWIHDEAVLVRDEQGNPKYWQGVMSDITARREAENSLADAEARYRALVEQTPTITYLDSPSGRPYTLYMSPQTTSILGYTPQDWYDDDDLFDKLVHPDDVERAATRARVGGRARRDVPLDRQGRPDRVDPRPGDPDPGRRGQAEVLAGRADRHHRASALAGAGARPDARARGRATPPRRRRDEEHVPAGRLARPPDAARRASWAWPSRWDATTWSWSRTRCAIWPGASPRTPASSTGSSRTCSTWIA